MDHCPAARGEPIAAVPAVNAVAPGRCARCTQVGQFAGFTRCAAVSASRWAGGRIDLRLPAGVGARHVTPKNALLVTKNAQLVTLSKRTVDIKLLRGGIAMPRSVH
jgi:hypothetical protein